MPMFPVVNAQIFGVQELRVSRTVYEGTANSRYHSLQAQLRKSYSTAMPFLASSFFALSFLARCASPMPRSTLGALVNWMLS